MLQLELSCYTLTVTARGSALSGIFKKLLYA